jgi:hypothetical protein
LHTVGIRNTLLTEIEIMEKEILYLKGKIRKKARGSYLRLLQSNSSKLGLNEPIYLMRYE